MQLCYDETLFTKLVVHYLPTSELTPHLAPDLEKLEKDPAGTASAETPGVIPRQSGDNKQTRAWVATALHASLQSLSLKNSKGLLSTFTSNEGYWK